MSDGMVNAVLVVRKGLPIWVFDFAAIVQWGRLEDTMSVGEIDDVGVATDIANAWLDVRSQPLEAAVYAAIDVDGAIGGVDYVEGDRLADPDLRVTEISFELRPDGQLSSTPTLASRLEENYNRNQAKVDRLIAEAGGTAPSTGRADETGSGIESGKLQARQVTSWSWSTEEDLFNLITDDPDDEEAWQPYPIDEPVRLTEMVLECQHLDGDGFPNASGSTRFRLAVNGVAVTGPGPSFYDVVVGSTEDRDQVSIFGTTIVRKGDTVSCIKITDGGHLNGSVTLMGSEVV
jgi:hypothetical protein